VASDAKASVGSYGGTATVTGIANVAITAYGGGITLNAGNHNKASIAIAAGSETALHAVAQASDSKGGSAAVHGTADVNLTASGAISINAGNNGNLTLAGGRNVAGSYHYGSVSSSSGHYAQAKAAHGGQATVTGEGEVTLNGASISLMAGNDIVIAASGLRSEYPCHGRAGGGGGPGPDHHGRRPKQQLERT
jgi:hypothetical protein